MLPALGEQSTAPGEEGTLQLPPPLLTTVTDALPELVTSAALVAVTVCVPAVLGAVYKPELLIVPTVLLPPVVPSTDQVTLWFDEA